MGKRGVMKMPKEWARCSQEANLNHCQNGGNETVGEKATTCGIYSVTIIDQSLRSDGQ
jgi:hypothetical protein